jgi:phage terminase large subunit GpA
MSASISRNWPRSGLSSCDGLVDGGPHVDLGFDGAEDMLRAWRDGLTPDPDLTVSAWADRHRVLSSRGASEAGPWRTSRTPYLREIMDALSPSHPCQRVTFMKGSQVGAPLALDTPIPTPDGWTMMGEIQPGDAVFDDGGKPVEVTGVSPVFIQRNCYEVVFSDGSSQIADATHLWTVDDEKKSSCRRRVTLTTDEIRGTFKAGKRRERNRYAIPVAGALDLPEQNDLPIHPYALGYRLGNGHKAQNQLTAHEDDVEEVASYLRAAGHDTEARRPWWIKGRAGNLVVRDQSWPQHLCIRGHDMRVAGVYSFVKRGNPSATVRMKLGATVPAGT